MKDYLMALRSKDDTPSPLLMTSRTSEEDVLDSFKAEVLAKQAGTKAPFSNTRSRRRENDAAVRHYLLNSYATHLTTCREGAPAPGGQGPQGGRAPTRRAQKG